MSPLARPLLALAAAALLHAACAVPDSDDNLLMTRCTKVLIGKKTASSRWLPPIHLNHSDSYVYLPTNGGGYIGTTVVGESVVACNRGGAPGVVPPGGGRLSPVQVHVDGYVKTIVFVKQYFGFI